MADISLNGRAAFHRGRRDTEDKKAGVVGDNGREKTLVIDFSYDDLPDPDGRKDNHYIPAGSIIEKARLQTITGFTGGTSYNIGLEESDGTAIDADGIDAAVAAAAISAADETVFCDGALIQATTPTTKDGYVVVAATGTFTAGKARLTITYTTPDGVA